MAAEYDPEKHTIKEEKTFSTPYGEIKIQEVETCQLPTCTSTHFRTTRDGMELAWKDNRNKALGETLLTLLGCK
jgi:hypothetical protein